MKKTRNRHTAALATLTALCAGAPAAQAQSSVILEGVVDVGMRYTRNTGGSITSLASGGNSTSRLVFRGLEDLGGGLAGSFWLEGSFLADAGTGPTGAGFSFDRRSTVSLSSGDLGELRLGRDWTPVFLGQVYSDPFFALGVGSFANFLNASTNTVFRRAYGSALQPTTLSRTSNSVGYYLPAAAGGFYGHAQYAFSEGVKSDGAAGEAVPAGNFRNIGARLGYRIAGVDVAAFGGTTRVEAQRATLKQQGIAAAYVFGDTRIRVSGAITQSRFLESKQTLWFVGVVAPINAFVLKAAFYKLDEKGLNERFQSIDPNGARQLTLGVDYYLSKRTAVYTDASVLRNRGGSSFSVAGGPALGITGGSRSRGVEFGIRHAF